MTKFATSTDGFVLEIERPDKTCIIICKRYTRNPISPADGGETTARIMDIIVDDLNLKTSHLKFEFDPEKAKKEHSKLVVRVFKNEDKVLGEEKIDLDNFPAKIKYKIDILHLIPEIMSELVEKK